MKRKGGRPNKVRNSIYRKKIDEKIIDGITPMEISAWLKKQDPPEKIGKTAIYDYINNHFNVEENAVQEYADRKSEDRLKDAGKNRADEIEKLKSFADMALGLDIPVNITPDEFNGINELTIAKYKLQIVRAGIHAQKAVNDFLKGVTPETPINLFVNVNERREKLKSKMRRVGADNDNGGDPRD